METTSLTCKNVAYAAITEQGYLPNSKIDRMAVVDIIVDTVESLIRADERAKVTAVMDDRIPGDPTLGQIADDLLAEIEPLIRADEREKIAAAIEAMRPDGWRPDTDEPLIYQVEAARIARSGGRNV